MSREGGIVNFFCGGVWIFSGMAHSKGPLVKFFELLKMCFKWLKMMVFMKDLSGHLHEVSSYFKSPRLTNLVYPVLYNSFWKNFGNWNSLVTCVKFQVI